MLDRSRSRDRSKTGGAFSPAGLFVTGAQGAWYDPSDFSTLYQDSTGTTPVTAVEQPVGLMLDRSRGLVLGSELVTNGSFTTDSDWTKGASWTISGGTANYNNAGAAQALSQTITMTAGRAYVITYTVSALSSGFGYARLVGSATTNGVTVTANGAYTEIIIAPASPTTFGFVAQGVFSIDNISVRELPGNHALQATSASRPVLRARYNLLTYSEEFDNAIWSKSGTTITANQYVDSQGASTLDRVLPTAGNATHYVQFSTTYGATQYIIAFEARYDNHRWISVTTWDGSTNRNASFDLQNGVVGLTSGGATSLITDLGGGLYRCTVTYTPTAGPGNFTIGLNDIDSATIRTWNAAGTEAFGLGRASLLTAADEAATGGAYQRIAAATVYDTSNPVWRPYLAFDGSDDSMSTSSIDFSGTDEMTVFAGVTKLSDAARGVVAELTAIITTPGSFLIDAPGITPATDHFRFVSYGSATGVANAGTSYPAPTTRVVTGIGDIGGDVAALRIDSAQVAIDTVDQGTGNYANAALFIGRRNNTSFPLNGRLYSLTVLGRTATAPELASMETWVAGKTGVNLP